MEVKKTYYKKKNINKKKRDLKWLNVESIPSNLMDFLELNFKHKNILLNRMSGMTLQEVGEIEGITRERVRQIESKIISILPTFNDVEKVKRIVLDYDITEKEFTEYIRQPISLFRFIRLADKSKVDRKPFEQYLLYMNKVAPQTITKKLGERNKFINHNNDVVSLDVNSVIYEILFCNRKEYTVDKLQQDMERFFSKYDYSAEKKISNRALSGRLSKRENVIHSVKGKFRYYKYDVEELMEYVTNLNDLFNVSDGIYGIRYFFELDPDLMRLLDIKNEAELANVLKKIGYKYFGRLNDIVRQSQVYIGNIQNDKKSKDKFYKDILLQFDGEPLKVVVNYLYNNFYLHKGSTLAYLSKKFASFIYEKNIVLNVPLPQNADFYIKAMKVVCEPIYNFEQVKKKLNKINQNVILSPQLIDRLGYYDRGNTIIKKKYSNQDEAFRALWLVNDYIFTDSIKDFHSRSADFKAYQFELSHDLIRIDYNRYMTIKKFEKSGFVKNDILAFIDEVVSFSKSDMFYTWQYLLNQGFTSGFVEETCFDSLFYERLIFTSPLVRTIQANSYIFINTDNCDVENPTLIKFIEYELGTNPKDIDDFIDELNLKYGLVITKSKVIEKLKQSSYVYSSEMRKVYPNKQMMYQEIYKI